MKKTILINFFFFSTFHLGILNTYAQSDVFDTFEKKFTNVVVDSKKKFFEKKDSLQQGSRISYFCEGDQRYRVAVKKDNEVWILVWPKKSDMVDVSVVSEKTLIANRRYYISGIPEKNASGKMLQHVKFKQIEELFFN